MNGLRNTVYDLLRLDTAMNGFGFGPDNVYPNYGAVDPPQYERFLIIRWGARAPGMAGVHPVDVSLWFYELDPDYTNINNAIKRCRSLIPGLISSSTGDGGWIVGVEDTGDSPDFFDDAWKRYTRNGTYRITASGM